MIDRYSRDAMKKIWTETARFDAFLKVEILATEAHANLGIVPQADYEKIASNARYDIQRLKDLEAITKHDVIAFTRTVSESLGEERKWLHYGLTSTDVVDTAQSYLLRQANEIIENDINKMLGVLKAKAREYEFTPCIGRTHGIHADVTSFGLKWARWYDELKRNLKRFKDARTEIETGKISGAVGNFANTPPYVEEFVCSRLGLNYAAISTQVLSRDLHAHYLMVLALIASMLEKMATEIRQLSRTEIQEVEEYFSENQKGSSAMPHKRNPITSENICGCARVMKSYVSVGLENNILWHERDISHSSAERIVLADATTLIDYMLNRYADTLSKLTVFPEQMKANIYLTNGIIFSGRIMTAMIDKGMSREEAYDLVQRYTMVSWNEKKDFIKLIMESPVMNHLTEEEITNCLTLDYYMKNVDSIYERLGIKGE